jgi:CRP-like cAMP-binding protein
LTNSELRATYFLDSVRRYVIWSTLLAGESLIRLDRGSMALAYRNKLLQALSPDAIERLNILPVILPLRLDIEAPGGGIPRVVFLEDGIASMTAAFQDGSETEIGVMGYEAILGSSSLLGIGHSLNRVYMQIAGRGYTASAASARREFSRHGEFHNLALRSMQMHFLQTAQTAGCNARHTVEKRLARWLLLCADRMESPVLNLPHDHIATMLGCNRSTVTVAAGNLQVEELILYTRSNIRILNRTGLIAHACECYRTLADYLATPSEFYTAIPA